MPRSFTSRWTKTAIAGAVSAILMALVIAPGAGAQSSSQPANKATAAASNMAHFSEGLDQELLAATMKTSKPTDLIMTVSLECSILTKLFTPGVGAGQSSSANVNASVRVWIEQTGPTGTRIVPIVSTSQPPQDGSDPNSGDANNSKVTFCQRDEGRRITDTETVTAHQNGDGTDEQQTYQETKTANSFSWILLNAGSDTYTYTVKADFVDTAGSCTKDLATEETCSEAIVGNRILVIEPTKMANNATVNN